MNNTAAAAVAITALAAGIVLGSGFYTPRVPELVQSIQQEYSVDNAGFVPVNVSVVRNNVRLRSGCNQLSFDVTEDQAFSINRALQGGLGARPLTHDIFLDTLGNFNVTLLAARIERFGDDIYYARLFMRRENEALEIDARPSDAIALALRAGEPLRIKESLLLERGVNVC